VFIFKIIRVDDPLKNIYKNIAKPRRAGLAHHTHELFLALA